MVFYNCVYTLCFIIVFIHSIILFPVKLHCWKVWRLTSTFGASWPTWTTQTSRRWPLTRRPAGSLCRWRPSRRRSPVSIPHGYHSSWSPSCAGCRYSSHGYHSSRSPSCAGCRYSSHGYHSSRSPSCAGCRYSSHWYHSSWSPIVCWLSVFFTLIPQ